MAPPGRARVESVSVENIMSLVDQVTNDLINGNIGEMLLMNLLTLVNDLQINGPLMEAIYKDSLDRAFITFRKSSFDLRLNMLSRKLILFLIEIRAQNWQLTDTMNRYYKSEEYLQMRDNEFIATPTLPLLPSPALPVAPLLAPGETINTSGKFVKPTKIPGKNYFKDEVVIRNSDSGKVMGIKGRRVHMIEEMSETVISFQRVNPGAKERLVQITGPDESHINYARQLMGDTIRRNASPVPFRSEHTDIERVGGSSSSVNSSASDESTRPQVAGYGRSKLHHSLSTNDASVGDYKYTVMVGGNSVKITGTNYTLVMKSKLALDKFFESEPQQLDSGEFFTSYDDDYPSTTSTPEVKLSPTVGQVPPTFVVPGTLVKPETVQQPSPPAQVAGRHKYSSRMMCLCAQSDVCMKEPDDWKTICPEVLRKVHVTENVMSCMQGNSILKDSQNKASENALFKRSISAPNESQINTLNEATKSREYSVVEYQTVQSSLAESIQNQKRLSASNGERDINAYLAEIPEEYRSYIRNTPDLTKSAAKILARSNSLQETNLPLASTEGPLHDIPIDNSSRDINNKNMSEKKVTHTNKGPEPYPQTPSPHLSDIGYYFVKEQKESGVQVNSDYYPPTPSPEFSHNSNSRTVTTKIKTTIPFRPPLTRVRSLLSTLPTPDQTFLNHEETAAISKASPVVAGKHSAVVPQAQPDTFMSHAPKMPKNDLLNLNQQTPLTVNQAIADEVSVIQDKPCKFCKTQVQPDIVSSEIPKKLEQLDNNSNETTSHVTMQSPQPNPNQSSQQNPFFIPVAQPVPYVNPDDNGSLQMAATNLRSSTRTPSVQVPISLTESNSLGIPYDLHGVHDPQLGLSNMVLSPPKMQMPFIHRRTSLGAAVPLVSPEIPKNDEAAAAPLKPSTKAFRPTITNPRLQFLNRTLPE